MGSGWYREGVGGIGGRGESGRGMREARGCGGGGGVAGAPPAEAVLCPEGRCSDCRRGRHDPAPQGMGGVQALKVNRVAGWQPGADWTSSAATTVLRPLMLPVLPAELPATTQGSQAAQGGRLSSCTHAVELTAIIGRYTERGIQGAVVCFLGGIGNLPGLRRRGAGLAAAGCRTTGLCKLTSTKSGTCGGRG